TAQPDQVRDLLGHGGDRGAHPRGDRARGGGATAAPDGRAPGPARRGGLASRRPRGGQGAAARRAAHATTATLGRTTYHALRAQRAESGTQRAVPVRLGQEVQALSRPALELRLGAHGCARRAADERPDDAGGGGGALR